MDRVKTCLFNDAFSTVQFTHCQIGNYGMTNVKLRRLWKGLVVVSPDLKVAQDLMEGTEENRSTIHKSHKLEPDVKERLTVAHRIKGLILYKLNVHHPDITSATVAYPELDEYNKYLQNCTLSLRLINASFFLLRRLYLVESENKCEWRNWNNSELL